MGMKKIIHLALVLGLLFPATEIRLHFLLYVFLFISFLWHVTFFIQGNQVILQEETELF